MDVQQARVAPTEHPQWEFEDEDEDENSKAEESDDQVGFHFIFFLIISLKKSHDRFVFLSVCLLHLFSS